MLSTPDSLSQARPKALRRAGADWEMDVEQLLRVSDTLYRPAVSTLRGRDAILQHLVATEGQDGLTAAAVALMDTPPTGAGEVFEVVGGVWRPGSPNLAEMLRLNAREALLDRRVLDLEATVTALYRTCSMLERRLAALESRGVSSAFGAGAPPAAMAGGEMAGSGMAPAGSAAGTAAAMGGPGRGAGGDLSPQAAVAIPTSAGEVPPPPALEEPTAALGGGAPQAASPMAPGEAAGPDDEPEQEVAGAAAEAEAGDASDAGESSDPGEPLLQLPDRDQYGDALESLIGQDPKMKPVDETPDLGEGFWLSPLLSDEGEEVGAICGDLIAVVRQGGILVMLSDDAQQEMIDTGQPTEDAAEAMSEIFNVQSRSFNDIEGNPHTKTQPLVQASTADRPWLSNPAAMVVFKDVFGGRTVLVSR